MEKKKNKDYINSA